MSLGSKGEKTEAEHTDKGVVSALLLGGCRLYCLCHFAVSTGPKQDSRRRAEMCLNQKTSGFQVRELAEK